MIYLQPNTSLQAIYISPFEARKFLPAFTNYLIRFTNVATEKEHFAVLTVEVDNERYTKANIATNSDTTNNVLIKESGLYTYNIWGQNSSSNLDPEDGGVVGLCEQGPCRVSAEDAWTIPSISVPDNVIYYE